MSGFFLNEQNRIEPSRYIVERLWMVSQRHILSMTKITVTFALPFLLSFRLPLLVVSKRKKNGMIKLEMVS